MDIEIIAKTKNYIVINKPAGILVHPRAGNPDDVSLVDWLTKKFPRIKKVGEDPSRPGLVHRLDREVSGLMVIARNQKSFLSLKQQFKDRKIDKYYTALVHGRISEPVGKITFPIKRSSKGFKMAAVPTNYEATNNAKSAITRYKTIKQYNNFTLLKVKIETGRTHQIRVHFLALDSPIVGDFLYSTKKSQLRNKKVDLNRLFLVADKLAFTDRKGRRKEFTVDMPIELKRALEIIK